MLNIEYGQPLSHIIIDLPQEPLYVTGVEL